ncbi:hypothetical protein RQP46_008472 [Phenoliferia psychrophenolica]
MAVGLTTGRTLLLRLDASASPSAVHQASQGVVPRLSAVSLNVRHSRPCNVVAFCPERPGLLAVGLEKARGESLLIFDVEASANSLEGSRDGPPPPSLVRQPPLHRNASPAAPASSPNSSTEPHPLISFGSSETVTSAGFLAPGASVTGPVLVAGMGGKWLRAFDLRAPSAGSAAATWGTRAVFAISPNPFNGFQFASHGDDGIIKLWDLRKHTDALLSFSEVDAGAVSPRARPTLIAKPLAEMAWSPTRRGIFTTLEKDSHTLRVWSLADGPIAHIVQTAETPLGFQPQPRPSQPPSPAPEEFLRLPVLLYDQKPPPFHLPLTSFAYATSPADSTAIHFIGISRDTANPGSSGHRLEIVNLPGQQLSGFTSSGLVVPTDLDRSGFRTFDLRTSSHDDPQVEEPTSPDEDASDRVPPPTTGTGSTWGRGRSLSLTSIFSSAAQAQRDDTPQPSGSVTPRRLSRIRDEAEGTGEIDVGGLAALGKDQSIVLRERVEKMYGPIATTNAAMADGPNPLIDDSTAEFWKWIARAEILSKDACQLDFDFRFRGVLSILLGFAPSSATSQKSPKAAQGAAPRSTYNDITRSLRIGDEARVKNAAYAAAAGALVSRRRIDGAFAISSAFAAQRKLALQSCGSDWEEDPDIVCQRFNQRGEHEAAARHAFFSGRLEPAMNFLRGCNDERLRLLAPVLAAYALQKESSKGSDSVYADLCRSLSSDGETPWIRAMFAYLASGDWRELVDETGLPLRDRVAVALRFLSDSEEALASGDLDAVVLFGLRGDGLDLISNFVDRTADVQTAAIACSFVYPGLFRDNLRVLRWIDSYRSMLDSMELYPARAIFDAAQGRRARAAMEQARASGRNTDANAVAQALKRAAPPQLLIRCQFCSVNISPRNPTGHGDRGGASAGVQATLCPNCSKSLPSCSVCLTKPSVHAIASDGYEEGAEHTVWNGDARSEAFLHEHHDHRQFVVGKRDMVVESSFEYGVRWLAGPDMTGLDDEARHIRLGFKKLQAATGRTDVPTAWFGGSRRPEHKHIRAKIHKELGVPLLYCSDTYADDLPYYVKSPLALDGDKDEGLLMIPYSLTNNDHRFLVSLSRPEIPAKELKSVP